jgi:hypothetical protein
MNEAPGPVIAPSRAEEREAVEPRARFLSVAAACAEREGRTLLRNRFLHVFAVLALAAGFVTTGLTPSVQAVPFILLQTTLYLVPLFGILVGLGSAHGELEEQPFLRSQPVSGTARLTGKAGALGVGFGVALMLAFLPALVTSARPGTLVLFWAMSVLLAGVFLLLGLAVGVSTHERTRGIFYALLIWLVLLVGFDLAAYAGAMLPAVQRQPLAWLGALLLNPVDAVRIAMLFHLEEVPFSVPSDLRLVGFWLDHILAWVLLLCAAWITGLLAWSRRQIERRP